jgi:hypothetical protein
MAPPVYHIRALAEVNIPERRVAAVARPAQHGVSASHFAREEHSVAVVGQEGVLGLVERLEVVGEADADGRPAAVGVAPGDIIAILDPAGAGIIDVDELERLVPAWTNSIRSFLSVQWMPSSLRPAWTCILRRSSSQRKTPANLPSNGTTALLKMLLDDGIRFLGMIGLRAERQRTSPQPAVRSSHGMSGRRGPMRVDLWDMAVLLSRKSGSR